MQLPEAQHGPCSRVWWGKPPGSNVPGMVAVGHCRVWQAATLVTHTQDLFFIFIFITVICKWPNVRGRHRLATAPPTAPRAWWLPGAPTRKVRSLGRLGTAQVPGRERRFTRNRRRHFSFDWGGRFLPGWGGRFRPTPAVGELRNRSSQPALQFL